MANATGVASLPIEQQVDALAQALLREYMHRKGYKRTLASFDAECPRTTNTISSRNLMGQLMYLDVIQARNKARPSIDDNNTTTATAASVPSSSEGLPLPRGPTFATIMEMLCSYRLRKRTIRHRRQQQTSTELENVPITDLQAFDSSDEEIVVSKASAARQATIAEVKTAVAERRAAKEARRAARTAAKTTTAANSDEGSTTTTGKPTKKDKKDKADKKDKKDKKSSSSSSAPPTSAPLDIDATPLEDPASAAARRPSRGGFDPLGASSGGTVLTGSASSSTSSAPKGTVGRNWTPGGAAIAAPSVGVGLGGAAASAPPPEDARQVSYVAGAGMSLSTNAARGFTLDRAELSKTSGALGGKKVGTSAPTGGESPPARSNSETFDASPGDSSSSRAVYDPHATASGVLKRQEPAMSVIKQARAAVVAADMGVPPPAPSFADAGGGVAATAAGKREKKRVVVIDA